MLRPVVHRLLVGFGIVFFVITLTFALLNLAPGDPARLWVARDADQATIDAARSALGLDRPLAVRYVRWLGAFARGDWGVSIATQRPVVNVIANALPFTLLLAGASLLITYVGGILVGAWQALHHRSRLDTGITVVTLVIYGIPAYWLAVMLVLVFTYVPGSLGLPSILQFPAFGAVGLDAEFLTPMGRLADRARHLALPLTTLGLIGIAGTARFVRGAVIDVHRLEYVRAARSKGIPPAVVRRRHVMRNALVPVVTLLGLSLPALVSGSVFVESIFAWPGMGRVMVDAVLARDYPVVMATTVIFAALVVVGNMVADLAAIAVDPRIRDSA